MTSKLTITDDKLSGLLSEMEKSFTGCQRHGYTDAAEEYDDMISALRELQERRKADSEPVAWTDTEEFRDVNVAGIGYLFGIDREANKFADPRRQIMLYRHAQPAPVVPDELSRAIEGLKQALVDCNRYNYCSDAVTRVESACRAAMLKDGNSPAHSDCCPEQSGIHPMLGADRPVAWYHTAKCKDENHSTCCFSYSPTHDFGPWYEKPQSQPHYLPESLDYDRALHFLSTEPRKVTPETLAVGITPLIPDGSEQRIAEAVELLKNAAPAMLADDSGPNGPLVGRLKAQAVPGWIPVSERMPEKADEVLCAKEFDGPGDWRQKVGYYLAGKWTVYGASWAPTHWMPLPAAPQEVKGE